MCGRFTLSTPGDILADIFELADIPNLRPRYNIAPTQSVTTIVAGPPPSRRVASMRWGLIPSWAKDVKIGNRMINARSETASGKPSFRSAFKRRRCLVPADGFYEWLREGKSKQPMLIGMADGAPFAMAGLWEFWRAPKNAGDPDGDAEGAGGKVGAATEIESFTILTCEPNEVASHVHDRMPVILPLESWDTWLDPEFDDREALQALMKPYEVGEMAARPVSQRVNNVRNDDPECLAPPAA